MAGKLTYDTQEEAMRVGQDLRNAGQPNFIRPEGKKFKIIYTPKELKQEASKMDYILEGDEPGPTPEEIKQGQKELEELRKKQAESPEARIRKGIEEKRISTAIEKGTKLSEEEEINKEIETAARRLHVKKAMEQTPEEMQKAFLIEKQQIINEAIRKRRANGDRNPGVLIPIYDKKTHQIIDYKWQVKGLNQTITEHSVKAGKAGMQTFATTASNIKSGDMNVGKKTAIVGLGSRMPNAIGESGNVPAIAQIPKVKDGNNIVKSPSILEEGKLGFEISGQGSKLRQQPNVERLVP